MDLWDTIIETLLIMGCRNYNKIKQTSGNKWCVVCNYKVRIGISYE